MRQKCVQKRKTWVAFFEDRSILVFADMRKIQTEDKLVFAGNKKSLITGIYDFGFTTLERYADEKEILERAYYIYSFREPPSSHPLLLNLRTARFTNRDSSYETLDKKLSEAGI